MPPAELSLVSQLGSRASQAFGSVALTSAEVLGHVVSLAADTETIVNASLKAPAPGTHAGSELL